MRAGDVIRGPRRPMAAVDPSLSAERLVRDPSALLALLEQCPKHAPSPLLSQPNLAARLGLRALWIKDDRDRMGLGSFKALGAAHAIARDAVAASGGTPDHSALAGATYVAASAGNHGISVAAGARIFGARAIVLLSDTVPEDFAQKLRAMGAEARRAGTTYEESMAAAEEIAAKEGARLLSDSTWPGYVDPALQVMEGYLATADEAVDQLAAQGAHPTHVLLQAGVGGFAAAVAARCRDAWGPAVQIAVIEPVAAPAIFASIQAGAPVTTAGPVSTMGRLDCKEPSHVALASLAQDADLFGLIDEAMVAKTVALLAEFGLLTSPSGGAGVAGLHHLRRGLALDDDSRTLAFLTEGAVGS